MPAKTVHVLKEIVRETVNQNARKDVRKSAERNVLKNVHRNAPKNAPRKSAAVNDAVKDGGHHPQGMTVPAEAGAVFFFQSIPSSAKLQYVSPAMTIWSSRVTSNTLSAFFMFSVTFMSCPPGLGFPDGWLCTRITD